jgi:PAS domain S-box-containing protein/putative nucleotidyltransferase with HDIG domain
MITPKASRDQPQDLRRRAQARLKSRTAGLEKISPEEARNLLQELHIHQVELEMQNEQLRQTQAELETALARYTDLYDFAPLAYLTLDNRGWVLEANLTAARLLATERSRLVQQPLAPFIRPKDRQKFRAYLISMIQDRPAPSLELTLLGKGGVEVAVQLDSLLVPDAAGHPQVRTTLVDLTIRKQGEEALKESEQKFRDIFHNAMDGILLVDPATKKFFLANPMISEMLGYSPQELENLEVMDIHPEKDLPLVMAQFDRLASQAEKVMLAPDIPVKRKDGRVFFADISAFPVTMGGQTYLAGFFRDVTQRKETEEALKNSLGQLHRTLKSTVTALTATVETRDPYISGHQRRVADLAGAIAQAMGFSQEQLEGVQVLGLLHDIGKIVVPAEILSKPGKISEVEFNLIKAHVQVGYEILKDLEFPWPVAQPVLQHHERLDGSGYPQGLTGPDISLEARILAVADVVEAMTSHRPYRPALGIDKALEQVSRNRGVLYDPEVVDVCMKLFTEKTFQFN